MKGRTIMNFEGIKKRLTALIINALEEQSKATIRGEKDAKEEAAYHVGAMESRYDTFKEEAQYLASGHARRRVELEGWLNALRNFRDDPRCFLPSDKVRMGVIVTLKAYETGEYISYFIVPAGGGYTFEVDDEKFTTLNTASPLSASLILKGEGDEASTVINDTERKVLIVKIR